MFKTKEKTIAETSTGLVYIRWAILGTHLSNSLASNLVANNLHRQKYQIIHIIIINNNNNIHTIVCYVYEYIFS